MAADPRPTAEVRPSPVSYQDVVHRPTILIKEVMDIKNGSCYKGEPAFFYTHEEFSHLAAPFDKTLVGKFTGARPNMEFLHKGFQIIWFKYYVSLGLLDSHPILIRFS